jgi:hypothetical protein
MGVRRFNRKILIGFSPDISLVTCTLACLLILQENLLQSAVITDTSLLQKIPCKTNMLRDHHTNS